MHPNKTVTRLPHWQEGVQSDRYDVSAVVLGPADAQWHEQQLPFGQRSPSIHLSPNDPVPDDVGASDISVFLNRVITRHTSLRSTFAVGADGDTAAARLASREEHQYGFGEQRPGEEESGKAWLDGGINTAMVAAPGRGGRAPPPGPRPWHWSSTTSPSTGTPWSA